MRPEIKWRNIDAFTERISNHFSKVFTSEQQTVWLVY